MGGPIRVEHAGAGIRSAPNRGSRKQCGFRPRIGRDPDPKTSAASAGVGHADVAVRHDALVLEELEEGELLILSEVLSDEKFVATRFYREWLQPRKFHHVLSLIVSRKPASITGLSLLRRPEQPAFAQAERELLRRLLPHLRRVVQLQEMLIEACVRP